MFKIRILSPWENQILVGDFHFSSALPAQDADALLCDWAPNDELLTFPKSKAWYCCEATSRVFFQNPEWKRFRHKLKPSEFLYHAHPNKRYRVPHITHLDAELKYNLTDERPRLNRAVAIVSNTGGSPRQRTRDISLRNHFATHHLVDLYGNRNGWENYRASMFSRPRLPSNYKGEIPGTREWHNPVRFELMAIYKVAVCLENTCEPYYFTEKFVVAVQSGCIPVYHADATVRDSILRGAQWVDPAAFKYDVRATLEYALGQNLAGYQSINNEWLASEPVRMTHYMGVYERIGRILSGKAH